MPSLKPIDLHAVTPAAVVILAFVAYATIRSHFKAPEAELVWWKATLRDTGEALLIILCTKAIQYVLDHALGLDYSVGGIGFHDILDYAHLAVLFRWMVKCLLRMLPPR